MEKHVNVPKLRFPEFTGEWEKKTLGEIATFSKGKGISKADISETGELECIRYGELYTTYGETILNVKSRTNIDVNELVLSELNDVIIPASGESPVEIAKASCVLKTGIALGSDLNIIKTIKNGIFLSYYLNNSKKNDIANLAQGVSVVHLYPNQLTQLIIKHPSLPEQTKIANFLSAVDDKINQLKKKKDLLEKYKKGVMQKIFSQEIRFKDDNGVEFAEWEEKKIKDVFRFKQGVQCGIENQYSEKGDNMQRFIRIIDLTSTNEPIRYIDSPGVEHHIKPNDIFMVRYGTPGLVGYGYEGIIANNLFRIIPIKEVINKFYYFVFNFLNQELSILASSSTMPALSFSSLEVLSIPIPSLAEQTKIANFLSAIDDKICHCGTQIEGMERWKKGLLQQMFV